MTTQKNNKNHFSHKHIIDVNQFDKNFVLELLKFTNKIKSNPKKYKNTLKDKIVAMIFYEASTRTRFSFESAVYRLGGNIITTENAREFSSASKGETIEDSIKVIATFVDFIILRHFEDDSSERACAISKVPLINAGAGKNQHPTQALLDVYTIYDKFGKLENLKITIVGDLLRGRTVNSLIFLLSKFKHNEFYFVSPKNSKLKKEVLKYLKKNNIKYTETENLQKILSKTDVLYMTRIQKERFENIKEYKKAENKFILDQKGANTMPKNAIIMHPLPRVEEISKEVDDNKRAVYFEQVENGLYVRMALLKLLNDYNYGRTKNK